VFLALGQLYCQNLIQTCLTVGMTDMKLLFFLQNFFILLRNFHYLYKFRLYLGCEPETILYAALVCY